LKLIIFLKHPQAINTSQCLKIMIVSNASK